MLSARLCVSVVVPVRGLDIVVRPVPLPGVVVVPVPGVVVVPLPGVVDVPLPGVVLVPLPGVVDVPLPGVVDVPLPGVVDVPLPGVVLVPLPGGVMLVGKLPASRILLEKLVGLVFVTGSIVMAVGLTPAYVTV
jgi:hypothetical protein